MEDPGSGGLLGEAPEHPNLNLRPYFCHSEQTLLLKPRAQGGAICVFVFCFSKSSNTQCQHQLFSEPWDMCSAIEDVS